MDIKETKNRDFDNNYELIWKKLQDNLLLASRLNEFVSSLEKEDNLFNDLDVIATHIAFELHKGIIQESQIDHLPVLIKQISKRLDFIAENQHETT